VPSPERDEFDGERFLGGHNAALAGFDRGETATLPSVHDSGLWEAYDAARQTLFAATQNGRPAPRYQLA
jgi:hypothetical protein